MPRVSWVVRLQLVKHLVSDKSTAVCPVSDTAWSSAWDSAQPPLPKPTHALRLVAGYLPGSITKSEGVPLVYALPTRTLLLISV